MLVGEAVYPSTTVEPPALGLTTPVSKSITVTVAAEAPLTESAPSAATEAAARKVFTVIFSLQNLPRLTTELPVQLASAIKCHLYLQSLP
jgi:hypothetical protein